jgi:hypothetical protein
MFLKPASAFEVPKGTGVYFAQVDFTFPNALEENSNYGYIFVDYSEISSKTSLSHGFVNVSTSQGWVVQNLPVDLASGLPGLSTMFNLGEVNNVELTSLNAYVDFSMSPTDLELTGPLSTHDVKQVTNNAEGRGGLLSSILKPAAKLIFSPGTTILEFVSGHMASVQTAINQCGPAAIANSLQFLKDTTGLNLRDENIPGLIGNPPNSMVGQIDLAMGRGINETVVDSQFINGKLNYANQINARLTTKFQGGIGLPPGDIPAFGQTAIDKGDVPTVEFIMNELKDGEDVEMAISWDEGGGHWVELVGAGRILGKPWVAFAHDANQSNNPMDTTGTSLLTGGWGFSFLEDTDNDGTLNFHNYINGGSGEVDFVVSESPVPGPIPAAGAWMAFSWSRKIRRRIHSV